jgi:ABC-2 type transport system ATP-binding protein
VVQIDAAALRKAVVTAQVVPPAVGLEWVNAMAERRRRVPVLATRDLGLRYDVQLLRDRSIGHAIRDLVRPRSRDRFWALRHVDLTVRAGDCVAVIGPNGAGKSTLLQVIAQLIEPDEGEVLTKGRVSALLNLGVGFDPRLTGRENVELLGALMGLHGSEVRERMPGIVEFADLGSFIDAPLRTYSSGMRARLGFAAATMIEPNILVLDEVLGTGDVTFRERSRSRVMDLIGRARAVVTATHDMTWVAEFATYAVLLERGRIVGEGAPSAVTAYYRARSARPRREYACPGCQAVQFEGYCPSCGLLRREREPGEDGGTLSSGSPPGAESP